MNFKTCLFLSSISVFLLAGISIAGEHPSEHPTEHPAGPKSEVTTSLIEEAIKVHIENKARPSDGSYIVYDKEKKKDLALKMKRIHSERLSALKNGIYFACVDFQTKEGKIYDIDFFLKDTENGLKVTEVNVHKEDGNPRYSWQQSDDFWSKKK